VTHAVGDLPGYDPANDLAGGACTGNVAGKFALIVNIQHDPELIGAYELAEGGPGPGITPPNLIAYNIYRNDNFVEQVPKEQLQYFDLNLLPGNYSYGVTAVYEAPTEGESMKEGPADITIRYGIPLPFEEKWSTGMFISQNWNVEGSNWRIQGAQGNPAPSAEFNWTPVQHDYSYALESDILVDGLDEAVYHKIWFDFDIFLDAQNATEEELLTVEVWNIDGWHQVAEFKNTADMPWTPQHIDISQYALDQAFKIRYTAHGASTADINKWQVDNISVYHEMTCDPPRNLAGVKTGIQSVHLTWEEPGVVIAPGEWIGYDNGENYDGIGLTGGGSFMLAIRWDASQLAQYAGQYVKQVKYFPRGATTSYVLKIWTGANAANLVVDQPITGVQPNMWNTVTLDTPVPIDVTRDLWIGYSCDDPAGEHPAGCDAGPAVAGYGDMISLDGVAWESMATAYSLNYNWNLQAFVEGMADATTPAPLQPLTKTTFRSTGGIPAIGHLPVVANNFTDVDELLGYNVYRSGVQLNTDIVTDLFYDDIDVPFGSYDYTVKAIYDGGCEAEVGPVTIEFAEAAAMPFIEPWDAGTFDENMWTIEPEQSNWKVNSSEGNPAPTAEFNWSPTLTSYSTALVSRLISGEFVTNVTLNFDLYLSDYSSNGAEKLAVEVWDGTTWNLVNEFTNTSNIEWTTYSYDVSQYVLGHNFKVRFRANGASSFDINYWYVDNIKLYERIVGSLTGTVTSTLGNVANATVTLGAYTGTTNANGVYNIENIETGTYDVTCAADGYAPATVEGFNLVGGVNTLDFALEMEACLPPTNLNAEIQYPYGHPQDVKLTWTSPFGGGTGEWIGYDDGANYDGIGLTDGGQFLVAARWDVDQLAQYNNMVLTQVKFFPRSANSTFVLKVWTGANAANLVVDMPLSGLTIEEWNTITLTTPVLVNPTQELWIGYSVDHPAGEFPAGCDAGPAVANYGDLISTDGAVWEPLSGLGLDYNWNLKGYLAPLDGGDYAVLSPLPKKTIEKKANSSIVKGNLPVVINLTDNGDNRSFIGYNIYRDDVLIANNPATQTWYMDTNVPISSDPYTYYVTAVYTLCESDPSNSVDVLITGINDPSAKTINIYPNPASSYVNIETAGNISSVKVMNLVGQVVYEQTVTETNLTLNTANYEAGAYMIQLTTNEGQFITKRLVITK
ncbi:MAG: carboxypeptidase regulatory-like domain-containing protein, partial [Lentimicrobiaceae bacterium]|nr:carboxypeptidase regulatory-like domain-containing protein [Lentimicrobiaceae bacterium]